MRTLSTAEASFISGGAAAPNNSGNNGYQCTTNNTAGSSVTSCRAGDTVITTVCRETQGSGSLEGGNKLAYGKAQLGGGSWSCTTTITDLETKKSHTIKVGSNDSDDNGARIVGVDDDGSSDGNTLASNGYGEDSSSPFSGGISGDSIGGAGAHYHPDRFGTYFLERDRSMDFL